jgi:hypothetical protein
MKPEIVAIPFVAAFLILVILAWRRFRAVDRKFARMHRRSMNCAGWNPGCF